MFLLSCLQSLVAKTAQRSFSRHDISIEIFPFSFKRAEFWNLGSPDILESKLTILSQTLFCTFFWQICNFIVFWNKISNLTKSISVKSAKIQNLSSLDIMEAICEKKLETNPPFLQVVNIFAIFMVCKNKMSI